MEAWGIAEALGARGYGKGRRAKELMLERMRMSEQSSLRNVVLTDTRWYVRNARVVGNRTPYQKAFSKFVAKRDYDGGYQSLNMVRVDDPEILDEAQVILYRLARLERLSVG